jgi:hypothetical protein
MDGDLAFIYLICVPGMPTDWILAGFTDKDELGVYLDALPLDKINVVRVPNGDPRRVGSGIFQLNARTLDPI